MSIISSATNKTLSTSILGYTPDRKLLKQVRDGHQSRISFGSEQNFSKQVQEIFREYDKDEKKNYENLLYKLSKCDIRDDELLNIIKETSQSIPLIRSNYNSFIEALFAINWLKKSPVLITEFHNLIVDILAARSEFLVYIVTKIVGWMVPENEDAEDWEDAEPSLKLQAKLNLVHNLLKRLLEVIPMISQTIKRQLISSFPYYKKPNFVTLGYIHNLLWILEYYPNYKSDLLELILQKILNIDINVSRAEIEESELADEEMDDCLFEMEKFANPRPMDENTMKNPVAETLDLCMEKLMDYFYRKFKEDLNFKATWEIMLSLFDSIVLPTHNTQHIQFLYFYICSLKNCYTDYFLSFLWRKVTNINLAANYRVTAVGYLSSFLARAKFIPMKTTKMYLKELCNWAHQYTMKCDTIINHVLKAHTVFYAICQSVFYIVSFRSKDLTVDNSSLVFMQNLHLSSIVASQLNPLRVCLPAVATIFAGVTRTYQLAYCHTILERNARRKLATIYLNDNELPEECLESVFPFDPYLLKKSFKRIEPIYMPYQVPDDDHDSHEMELETRRRKRMESLSMSAEENEDFIFKANHKKQKISEDFIYSISPGFNM